MPVFFLTDGNDFYGIAFDTNASEGAQYGGIETKNFASMKHTFDFITFDFPVCLMPNVVCA